MQKKWPLIFILFALLLIPSAEASIIKKPPGKTTELAYKDLPCTEAESKIIHEIISTVGEHGKLSLAFKQTHLRELGAQINHLHPLRFLSVIFTDPYLKSCMMVIWNDYFKRSEFLGGLVPNLSREADRGKLNQYIPDFAAELSITEESVRPFFNSHDWESLVARLIYGT